MIGSGQKSAADVARLFKVHPATVSRLIGQAIARPPAWPECVGVKRVPAVTMV